MTLASIAFVILDWNQDITASYEQDDWSKGLMEQLILNPNSRLGFTLSNGVLRYQGRLVIGDNHTLKEKILETLHGSPLGSHLGMSTTELNSFSIGQN